EQADSGLDTTERSRDVPRDPLRPLLGAEPAADQQRVVSAPVLGGVLPAEQRLDGGRGRVELPLADARGQRQKLLLVDDAQLVQLLRILALERREERVAERLHRGAELLRL